MRLAGDVTCQNLVRLPLVENSSVNMNGWNKVIICLYFIVYFLIICDELGQTPT